MGSFNLVSESKARADVILYSRNGGMGISGYETNNKLLNALSRGLLKFSNIQQACRGINKYVTIEVLLFESCLIQRMRQNISIFCSTIYK